MATTATQIKIADAIHQINRYTHNSTTSARLLYGVRVVDQLLRDRR